MISIIVIIVLAMILELCLARWAVLDAEGRGMNPFRWRLIVFVSPIIGLAIHLLVRQQSFDQ